MHIINIELYKGKDYLAADGTDEELFTEHYGFFQMVPPVFYPRNH